MQCCKKFGPLWYGLITKDHVSGHSKGTGFVKFKNKESANMCMSAGTELRLFNQVLDPCLALSRQDIFTKTQESKQKEAADSRNLYLSKEGVIVAGTSAAEGVSVSDMAKRHHLERVKNQMLKNLNRFMSKERLTIHNVPADFDSMNLRKIVETHAKLKEIFQQSDGDEVNNKAIKKRSNDVAEGCTVFIKNVPFDATNDDLMQLNLLDMPQLVTAKIMSLLNHKDLLIVEQVSKNLKYAVEDHFQTTDHLIIGSLPSLEKLKENKKLLKLLQRCGIRLRTIQFNAIKMFFEYEPIAMYWLLLYNDHLFESGGEVLGKTCPNIEHIITSPKVDTSSTLFNGQVVGLTLGESYANHLYKIGEKCKLRAIRIYFNDIADDEEDEKIAENKLKAIVDCYSNLKQILLSYSNHKQFLRYLPQLIKNGLKDLKIECDNYESIDFQDAKQYCNIGNDLRTLRFAVKVESNIDVVYINQLHLPKGLELEIIESNTSYLAMLNANVCDSVVKLVCKDDDTSDCISMIKLKNLREFENGKLEHIKLIAKESFPKLKKVISYSLDLIRCNPCKEALTLGYRNSVCDLKLLPELLTNKGNQLSVIIMRVCSSLDLIVKAAKHCTAARSVELLGALNLDPCTASITTEDIIAILQLPNLQKFMIVIIVRASSDIDDLKQKMINAENGQTHFKFEYDELNISRCQRTYTFERINL